MSDAASWLVHASAYARLGRSPDAAQWVERIGQERLHLAPVTVLEIGRAARSGEDWSASVRSPPATLMPLAHATPAIERRALEVQGMLARRGLHRGPPINDLVVAATAELSGLILLHADRSLELIAQLTGQTLHRLRVS